MRLVRRGQLLLGCLGPLGECRDRGPELFGEGVRDPARWAVAVAVVPLVGLEGSVVRGRRPDARERDPCGFH